MLQKQLCLLNSKTKYKNYLTMVQNMTGVEDIPILFMNKGIRKPEIPGFPTSRSSVEDKRVSKS